MPDIIGLNLVDQRIMLTVEEEEIFTDLKRDFEQKLGKRLKTKWMIREKEFFETTQEERNLAVETYNASRAAVIWDILKEYLHLLPQATLIHTGQIDRSRRSRPIRAARITSWSGGLFLSLESLTNPKIYSLVLDTTKTNTRDWVHYIDFVVVTGFLNPVLVQNFEFFYPMTNEILAHIAMILVRLSKNN